MFEITLNRKETMSRLVKLSRLLSEAIDWVCQQDRRIIFEVPADCAKGNSGGNCLLHVPPRGREEAEVLIGILRTMSRKGRRRTGRK